MLINRHCGNWTGQVSKTIGSPSCIIHHPLLYLSLFHCSSAENFTTPPSPLFVTLLFSPLLSSLLPLSYLPLNLLTVTLIPQGPLLSSLQLLHVVVLDGSIMTTSLATIPFYLGRLTAGCQPEMELLTFTVSRSPQLHLKCGLSTSIQKV